MRNLIFLIALAFLSGCTSVSKLDYEVISQNKTAFTDRDVTAMGNEIAQFANVKRGEEDNTFYLNQSSLYSDIMKLDKNADGLFIRLTRIAKPSRRFSFAWKDEFTIAIKRVIRNTTQQDAKLNEIAPDEK